MNSARAIYPQFLERKAGKRHQNDIVVDFSVNGESLRPIIFKLNQELSNIGIKFTATYIDKREIAEYNECQ